MKRTALLVIDAQVDFCDVNGASLPVAGATKDIDNIAAFIKNVVPSSIFASQDTHYVMDISHPGWWRKADGTPVDSFTLILADDIKNGKYTAVVDPVGSLKYVEALEANGEFKHFIWPEHCITGTVGHSFLPTFTDAINNWMRKNKRWTTFIRKGEHPMTEHFGIFRANVPNADPSTQVNQDTFTLLNTHDEIYLTGEARTHCVANSMKQLLEIAPNLASKLVVLTDCMSNVVGGLPQDFYDHVDGMYDAAKNAGVRFAKSTEV